MNWLRRIGVLVGAAMATLGVVDGPAAGALVPGYQVLTFGHVDIVGVNYEDSAWDLHVHDEEDDVEYAPNEALIYVALEAVAARPAGGQWEFLGSGVGGSVWVLPEVEDPGLVWPGISAEEVADGIFEGDAVLLRLLDVRGPGYFSLWQSDAFGEPIVAMASSDGISAVDQRWIQVGESGHTHANWGFSAPGYYELDFEASGTLVDGSIFTSSGPVTYYFGVETQVVPEASTLALAGLAAGVAVVGAARQQRR